MVNTQPLLHYGKRWEICVIGPPFESIRIPWVENKLPCQQKTILNFAKIKLYNIFINFEFSVFFR